MSEISSGGLILDAASASATSDWQHIARCSVWSATVRVTVTAATLQGTVRFKGTDFDAKSGSEATLEVLSPGSALPTGITYANGVLTLNNPSIGTSEVVLVSYTLPRFLQAAYLFTSGGGTVAVKVAISGW